MALISKITLPSGSTYDIKDAALTDVVGTRVKPDKTHETRISTLEGQVTALTAGSLVYDIVETLPTASADTTGKIFMVAHADTAGTNEYYDEYMTIDKGASANPRYVWEHIGNTDVDLSGYAKHGDAIELDSDVTGSASTGITVGDHTVTQGTTSTKVYFTKDEVYGTGTTFTNSTSSVTFSGGTSDSVLGADTTATVPGYKANTTYLGASASGASVGIDGSASAITSLGDPTTVEFVKSYPGASSKLVTTSVPNVTANTSVTIPNVTGNTAVTATKISSYGSAASWGASVTNETLTISWTPNEIAAGSDVDATNTTLGAALTATNTTLGTAITVATGSLDSNGSGSTVMTGLGTATKEAAVTGYANVSTDTFAQGVKMTAQPTITLSSNASNATGRVNVATGVATNGTNAVTFATNDTVTAVTGIGTGTAAAQTITVGTGDKVNAVISISGTTSTGASNATLSGTNSGIAVSKHSVTDNGHTHSVTATGTISE